MYWVMFVCIVYCVSCLHRGRGPTACFFKSNFSPLEMNSSYYLHPASPIFPSSLRRRTQPWINLTPNGKAVLQQLIPDRSRPTPRGTSRFPTNSTYGIGAGLNPLTSNEEQKNAEWKRTAVARCGYCPGVRATHQSPSITIKITKLCVLRYCKPKIVTFLAVVSVCVCFLSYSIQYIISQLSLKYSD